MNWGDIWPAPAKLNLMLRIVGRRADGYHQLQTVFQFVDIVDQLRFRLRDDGMIHRTTTVDGVPEESDLSVRAARLLQTELGRGAGVDIELTKNLPLGAGLGGGSSDAATTLVALNQLWNGGLTPQQLADIGLQLGADVPVFVHGVAAWAEGVGELLQPLELPTAWYLIIFPSCHVSTTDIFSDPELTRDSGRITIADFFAGSRQNDCLPVVCERHPEVAEAIEWLAKYGDARLTGTGAAVFTAFESEDEAREVLARLPEHMQGATCQGINRSPVLDQLPREAWCNPDI